MPERTAPAAPGGGWVRATAPATTANLGPGFDTLGLALAWTQTALCALAPEGVADVAVDGPGAEGVPRDERNLIVRAATAVCGEVGLGRHGLRVRLTLELPVGRGLGSSAAAVALGLVAANALAGQPLAAQRLLEIGTQLEGHPDNVAPALFGGLCAACQDGGRVWAVRLAPPEGLRALLAIPDRPLSTAEARAALPRQVPLADAVANVQRTGLLVAALAAGRLDALGVATQDRLHQPYRASLIPGLEACLRELPAVGARGAFLSGAGPTVLALVDAAADTRPVAARLEGWLAGWGGGRVRSVGLAAQGAAAVPVQAPTAG